MRIDRRLLGWGLFLIIVGALPLLVRAGQLDRELVDDWPLLWPLLLIGSGVGLVLRRTPGELLGSAISLVTAGVMVGGFIATGFGGVPSFGTCGEGGPTTGNPAEETGTLGASAEVDIEFSCGTLDVSAEDRDGWRVVSRSPDGRAPRIEADEGSLAVRAAEGFDFDFGDATSRWEVTLPQAPELTVDVTLNAGSGTVDLAGANLDTVDMTLNAGELRLALADATSLAAVDATVNAGSATVGLPATVGEVDLSLNAGSLRVCLPEDAALRVTWSGALGSNNLDGLGLRQVDDETWTTDGFDESAPHVELDVSANAGSFELDLGGTCGA